MVTNVTNTFLLKKHRCWNYYNPNSTTNLAKNKDVINVIVKSSHESNDLILLPLFNSVEHLWDPCPVVENAKVGSIRPGRD